MVKTSLESPSLPVSQGSAAAFGGTAPTVVLNAGTAVRLVVPNGVLLLDAEYVREGADLLLIGEDGSTVLIRDYFAVADPPLLLTEGGARVPPPLAHALAGPAAPAQVAQAQTGAGPHPIGRVDTVEGEAIATRVDGTSVVLSEGAAVFEGDVLSTGIGGAVGIIFIDDTTFSLGEDGRMVLDSLVYDPSSNTGASAFSIVQGVFTFVSGQIAASAVDAMTVHTPVMSIAIRGTTVAGQAAVEGERNVVTLLENTDGSVGEISVTNAGGTIVLNAVNQTTQIVSFTAPPLPPVVLSAESIVNLYGDALRALPQPGATPSQQDITTRQQQGSEEQQDDGDEPANEGSDDDGASDSVSDDSPSPDADDAGPDSEKPPTEAAEPAAERADAALADGDAGAVGAERGEQVVALQGEPAPDDPGFGPGAGEGPGPGELSAEAEQAATEAAQQAFQGAIAQGLSEAEAFSAAAEAAAAAGGFGPDGPDGQGFGLGFAGAGGFGLDGPLFGPQDGSGFGPGVFAPNFGPGPFDPALGPLSVSPTFGPSPFGPDFGLDPFNFAGDFDFVEAFEFFASLEEEFLDPAFFDTGTIDDALVALDEPLTTEIFFIESSLSNVGVVLAGTSGDDVLNGTELSDVIDGGDGSDVITGFGGDYFLNGNLGDDIIDGGPGSDLIDGGAGNDTLFGGDGPDILLGLSGADNLSGGNGDDLLFGEDGNDVLNGGAGNDTLFGGFGNDVLVFDALDTLGSTGGPGIDTLRIEGAGVSFNITPVAGLLLSRIEVIDLTGSGDNTLALTAAALIELSDTDVLRVLGNAGDSLTTDPGWLNIGTVTVAGQTFNQYINGGATLEVRPAIDQSGIGTITTAFTITDATASEGTGAAVFNVTRGGDTTVSATVDFATLASSALAVSDYVATSGTLTFAAGDTFKTITVSLIDDAVFEVTEDFSVVLSNSSNASIADAVGLGTIADNDRSLPLGALDGVNGFRIAGIDAGDQSGYSVSGAGDVNGDGFADIIIGAHTADPGGLSNAGESYVVLGGTSFGAAIALSTLVGTNGFRLDGIDGYDQSGISVNSAGDVNGDGFADIVIGASAADPASNINAGESYVVFGAPAFGASLALSALNGSNGFRIDGIDAYDLSDDAVSSAGDINGDGFADLLIGAASAEYSAITNTGQTYVVFGAASFGASLAVSSLNGTTGFRIDGIDSNDFSGGAVASLGDFNADGFDDIIIGADRGDPAGLSDAGESYVVFGSSAFAAALDLSNLSGSTGFRLDGIAAGERSGDAVGSAGDFNGDGFADLIIGAPYAAPGGITNAGVSYVVFGASSFGPALGLSSLNGSNGFRITGESANDYSGYAVGSAGDINGDGFDDLLIGAKGADIGVNTDAGKTYVLFGGLSIAGSGNLSLATLDGTTGFVLEGVAAGDSSGAAIGGAGDINGDGFDDLIVGAPNGGAAGASYVVFGGDFRDTVTGLGGSGNDTLTGTFSPDILIGGLGNDTLIGAGGVDVLRGGAGDDTLAIDDSTFRRIDGGAGTDTLQVRGAGVLLDLTLIGNGKVTGIERIDITGTGDNSLTLNLQDVLDSSDTSNQLLVTGNAGDTVTSSGQGWTLGTPTTIDGVIFNSYAIGAATLLVDTDIDQTAIT